MIPTHPFYRSIHERRASFPSLNRIYQAHPLVYLDGPAGSQMPQPVIDAMVQYYTTCNANTHGQFITSQESDRLVQQTRETAAAFLGAPTSKTISFGANMTTLTYSLSKAIGRAFKEGDEVLITQLDHEANRGPWLSLRERGIVVNEIRVKEDCTLDYDDLRSKISTRTRLVAMGAASNAFGTVNDITLVRELTSKAGAYLFVDAVHYAPHFPIDVKALDVDFLICSAYKFYGPHVGILYAREGLLDQLETDRLRTQDQSAPYRIETGTLNHAAILGVKAAIEFIASLAEGATLRERIVNAMQHTTHYERTLALKLYDGLRKIDGVKIFGPSFESGLRAPTVSFRMRSLSPEEVCSHLGEVGICTWDGHFYAIRSIELFGLLEKGGVTRVGVLLYNTSEEIDKLLDTVSSLAHKR
ncbi:MAG: cysteine desulfurase-like protein [bacterium]